MCEHMLRENTSIGPFLRDKSRWDNTIEGNVLLLFLQHSSYSLAINWKISARYESFSSCLISKKEKKEKRGKEKHERECKPLCV